ncbi:major facilitator superfamily domain-containing protein [Paramyrothecium foliicola]|nr:major facilitator superfamily domain-containing protein [Paramyrothecium foliicola]
MRSAEKPLTCRDLLTRASSGVGEPSNTSSATMVLRPETIYHSQMPSKILGAQRSSQDDAKPRSLQEKDQKQDLMVLPPPSTATSLPQRWNHPRSNISKVVACNWSFIVMGANDAAYGALIHYIERYYGLTYLIVSLIFLSPFVGYTLSALMNNWLHLRIGQRGIAAISSGCHLVAYLIMALHPPYPVIVVAFMVAGYGNGLADAAWNAYFSSMANANELLGFLHGFYGFGAVLSPLIATSMITKLETPWYAFYYLMIGMASMEVICVVTCFKNATAAEYKASLAEHADAAGGGIRGALVKMPAARVTWVCALFLLCYAGTEVSLGGWIVVFMIQVRGGEEFSSGMTATGFWLGLALGRIFLGFITPRIGERLAMLIYLPLAVGLQLLFWLVPQFIVSAVAVGLQGFFLGPLFPVVVVAMSKLLPRHLQVSAIGFAAAFGGGGKAILPFAVGALAQAKGVQVLQPIVLAFLAVLIILWLCLPKFDKKKV